MDPDDRPPSPIINTGSISAEIRSGMDRTERVRERVMAGPSSQETLTALASILENLTRQQQASMQVNHEFLAGLLSKSIVPPQRPRLSDIYIAPYNPDGDVPIRDWCEHVDQAQKHWSLTDYEICTKIASLLQGRAKALGDTWLVKSPVWADMREALIQTFEPEARYSNDILKLRSFKFDSSNPAESITKAWHIWKRVVSGNKDKDAVEAVIGLVKNGLTIIRNYEKNYWKKGLDTLQLAINCTKNKTTNVSPMKALTGRQCAVPAELISLIDEEQGTVDREQLNNYMQKKIEERGTQDKARFDKGKAKVKRFEKGEIVLFRTNPRSQIGLDLKYPDAYEIWKILPNDRYQVKKITGRGRPKKVAHDQLRLAPKPGECVSDDLMSAQTDETQNTQNSTGNDIETPQEPGNEFCCNQEQ
ncbi:hypothetical protein ABMA28_009401 [Loxostege sticticalis]|uniref:Uncharacterized protein n=1 Tax=Loxostege sticticalis TaxID=481309 RepID=A0ABD0SD69_LOXSC